MRRRPSAGGAGFGGAGGGAGAAAKTGAGGGATGRGAGTGGAAGWPPATQALSTYFLERNRFRASRGAPAGGSPSDGAHRASQIFLEASLPCCRSPRTSSVSNSANETLLSLLSGNNSRCAFAQGWQTKVRKAMQATVGPRAAQSAQRRLPSLFRASLTARVLRSIVSWEGMTRVFFWWSLGWCFGLALLLTGARATGCARLRGCSAAMCASVRGDLSA